ncbi:GLPGLI family protein [Pseudotenacibaculum sp. MALMAid0570]|uniref:GLPGLI family protein n=1 Tax=Pseudotenacibaculum sp. MALMAid0570 TaxID=3143938 RepID=UPI0032DF5C6D
MKTKTLFIVPFILFLSFTFYAQNPVKGKAVYKLTFVDIEARLSLMKEKMKAEFMDEKFMRNMERMYKTRELSYTLLFNDTVSLFYRSKNSIDAKGMLSIMGDKGKYYTSLKNKTILNEKEAFSMLFLIKSDAIDWEITKETKKIKGYTCYKAVGKRKFHGRKGWFEKEIVVWYTKEIPHAYGPSVYGGSLPGFIIESYNKNVKYEFVSIDFNVDDKIKIVKPTKGKKLTHLEFQKESKKLSEESMYMMRKN